MQGDEKAFEQLFKSLYKSLCSSANVFLNDPDEAEETVQNVFLALWEKREKMEINISVKAYLHTAVRNAALNKLKHSKVKAGYAKEQEYLASHAESPSVPILRNELNTEIYKAIESLPEQCRLVFKLSRFEELKYKEIAEQLGISVKTVENQMGKALRVLREKLKDYLVLVVVLLSRYFIE